MESGRAWQFILFSFLLTLKVSTQLKQRLPMVNLVSFETRSMWGGYGGYCWLA